jgi:hypothetical protein
VYWRNPRCLSNHKDENETVEDINDSAAAKAITSFRLGKRAGMRGTVTQKGNAQNRNFHFSSSYFSKIASIAIPSIPT